MKLICAAAALLAWPLIASESVSIKMEAASFRVSGAAIPASEPAGGWQSIFAVYAGEGDAPPMLGSYSIESGALIFHPRYQPGPGLRLRAVYHPASGADTVAIFETAKVVLASTTRVEHVYPSTDTLPDNQLKFYIYFSAPMRRGEAWQHIHLLSDKGEAVELPFLELDQELWDRDYRRFTVLFDPGRIKRGLLPLAEAGPALVEGRQYTFVVDRDWLDAKGAPLQAGLRKSFRAGPADRKPPDPAQWRIHAPKAGSMAALVVDFPEPMDYALLLRLLEIPGVSGTVAVDRQETEWRFTPDRPWKAGAYQLVADTTLEDLAGNRIGREFDVDTFERVSDHIERKTVSLPFRIGQN